MLTFNSLEERMSHQERRFQRLVEREKKVEEVLQILAGTKFFRNSSIKCSCYTSVDTYGSYIGINISNVPLETVISHLCPPIWTRYQSKWHLEPEDSCLVLRTDIAEISLALRVYEEDMQSCELIRIPVKVRSDEEVENYRVQYEYRMNCIE